MAFSIPARLRALGWNQRVLRYEDFEQACEDDGITLIVKPSSERGEYKIERGQDVITLDSRMHDPLRTFVAFHEYGHALFHVPGHFGIQDKTEDEADIIGYVALLPRRLLENCPPGDLSEMLDYPLSLIWKRWEILRRRGY
jgi:Zn-dependent peptidase ImmA (M78 family)